MFPQDVALQGWITKVIAQEFFPQVSASQLIGSTIGQIFGFYGLIPFCSGMLFSHKKLGESQVIL